MTYSASPAYARTRVRARRTRSMSAKFACAILGMLALISATLLSGQNSASGPVKIPIAIYSSFFNEEDTYPADLSVVAHCNNSQAPISFIAHEQTPEGKPKEMYFFRGVPKMEPAP